MTIQNLDPLPKEKVLFKFASFKSVPQESGCYVLTTFEDDILYIGLSDNLFDRFQKHLASPLKTNPTVKGKAVWFYFMKCRKTEINRLERTWINHYTAMLGHLPILNKINSPVS
jgi:excinuclease UvrABC nuclease subunit